jgi:uracil-DNA glycosylase family 4
MDDNGSGSSGQTTNVAKAPGAMCNGCPLYSQPFVPCRHTPGAELVVIGEAPGAQEVNRKTPFIGQSGQLIRQLVGDTKVFFTNVVSCRPPGNRTPTQEEIDRCFGRLELELEQYPDATLVPVGATSAEVILQEQWQGSITKTRGMWYQVGDRWVLPTFHPAYVLRQANQAMTLFRDIAKAADGHQKARFDLNNPPEVRYVNTIDDLHDMKKQLNYDAPKVISYDFETTQNSFVFDDIIMLGMAWCKEFGYIISKRVIEGDRGRELLNMIFGRDQYKWIGHNAKYDMHFGYKYGITNMRVDFDTMLAHYALDERKGTHGLKDLAREYFNVREYDQELVHQYLKSRSDDWSKVPYDKMAQYCVWDVVLTLELWKVLEWELAEDGTLINPFLDLLMPLSDVAFKMEDIGWKVDMPYLEHWEDELEKEAAKYLEKLRDMSGDPEFNPRSTKQLAHVMYDEMEIEQRTGEVFERQKGRAFIKDRSTSKLALAHMAIYDGNEVIGYTHPFVDTLFKYRRVEKILGTYIRNLINAADDEHRVHMSVFLHGTETGRISIRNPALQTIPRESTDRYGEIIRGAFIPSDGMVLIDCDYSQAEIRVFAGETQDPFLLKIYREGRDLHTEVGTAFFGKDFNHEHRMLVKKFNFGYIYGGGFSILTDADFPEDQARAFLKVYRENMKVAEAWRDKQFEDTRKRGYVQSRFGRRRRYPLITRNNAIDVKHASINMPVQATASDINMLAAKRLQDEGYRVLITIHDSVIVEVPEEEAEWHSSHVKQVMEEVGATYYPEVGWKADPKILKRWASPPES